LERNNKERAILAGKVVLVSVLVLLILTFLLRNIILQYSLEKVTEKIHLRTGGYMSFGHAAFSGINAIELDSIILQSPEKEKMLFIQHISFKTKLLPMLIGRLRLESIEIIVLDLLLTKNSKQDNFSFLLKKTEKNDDNENKKSVESIQYGYLVNKLLNSIFDIIPEHVRLEQISLHAKNDTFFLKAFIPLLELNDGEFSGKISTEENTGKGGWNALGSINKSKRTAKLQIISLGEDVKQVPILENKFKLETSFDTLDLALEESQFDNDQLILKGLIRVSNLKANHWRLSPERVTVKTCALDCSILIGNHSIQILDGSEAIVNDISMKPKFLYQLLPHKEMLINFVIPEMEAQVFFSSLPPGLFNTLEGIKANGNLSYNLHFFIDTRKPDSLEFNSTLTKKKFQINSFGNANLLKINDEFLYTAYEKGYAVKSFLVGPSNPSFTSLPEISPYLVNAVMTSEDGNFFSHNGFNEEAFRKSIVENYKKKRFARGGSTISMQLVKNVFLTRNKTISRKLEEAMIVWLLENNRLVSKERMLEVYFNIIEWGPGIYGVAEASFYYFKKRPSELSLEESIFLAMIVPRPKAFKYYFDAEGKLKEPYFGYFRLISGLLIKKGIIQETEKIEAPNQLVLSGAAKELVIVPDTLGIDSLQLSEELFE